MRGRAFGPRIQILCSVIGQLDQASQVGRFVVVIKNKRCFRLLCRKIVVGENLSFIQRIQRLGEEACIVWYCVHNSVLGCGVTIMPGVNGDLLPAAEAPMVLGGTDSSCAESGLEAVIGDLLVRDEEDEEEDVGLESGLAVELAAGGQEADSAVHAMEVTLRCAVAEVHADLKAFRMRVDARLGEAAGNVAPLEQAVCDLQGEVLQLRAQQESLARQVEALCQAMAPHMVPAATSPVTPSAPTAPTPHPPAFATRCSVSAPSLWGFFHGDSMVCVAPPRDFP